MATIESIVISVVTRLPGIGPMAGEKIDQAKAALKFCIDKLDERDRFDIVRFSTGFDAFKQEIAGASKDAKAEAKAWVEKFTAAGGTNINDALKAALDLRPKADEGGRPFVVVFITDGQGNQPAEDTLKLVASQLPRAVAVPFVPPPLSFLITSCALGPWI